MTTNPTDGGPAFPFTCKGPTTAPEIYYGMSLRDWFAGMALEGLLAFPHSHRDTTIPVFCENAYAYADAMLAARERKEQGHD